MINLTFLFGNVTGKQYLFYHIVINIFYKTEDLCIFLSVQVLPVFAFLWTDNLHPLPLFLNFILGLWILFCRSSLNIRKINLCQKNVTNFSYFFTLLMVFLYAHNFHVLESILGVKDNFLLSFCTSEFYIIYLLCLLKRNKFFK